MQKRIKSKLIVLLIPILLLTSCSSVRRITHDETKQASSLEKVQRDVSKKTKDEKAKDGEIANLTQQVKILLSMPQTDKTIPIENKLLDTSLTLTGAPSDNENILEDEVQSLLATQQKYEATISSINRKVTLVQDNLSKDDIQISKDKIELTKNTTTLYQDALQIASSNDTSNTIRNYCIAAIVMVFAFILLRIFLSCTQTGATIAAKLP